MKNKYGLTRRPPAEVRREVRQRSRFGCVICRKGFYQFEHIEPEFKNAAQHDPNNICCLCGGCHDDVTRGRISKELIRKRYEYISNAKPCDIEPVIGPLDFHTGKAVLQIAGLNYAPLIRRVLTYYNEDIIRVDPSDGNQPGCISAVFLDDKGQEILRLDRNEWIGDTKNWDLETTGNRLTIRQSKSNIALSLELKPPGLICLDHLDMRIRDSHVLVGKNSYAVGRYISSSELIWTCADIVKIGRAPWNGIAIEISDALETQMNYYKFKELVDQNGLKQQVLMSQDGLMVMSSGFGVSYFPTGVTIARGCGNFGIASFACGKRNISAVRNAVKRDIGKTMEAIAYKRPTRSKPIR